MNISFNPQYNSYTAFGSKTLPFSRIVKKAQNELMVVDPFSKGSAIKGFEFNNTVIDNLPHEVLKSIVKQIHKTVLGDKPVKIRLTAKIMKAYLKNLVSDTTPIGEKYRDTFNRTVASELGKNL